MTSSFKNILLDNSISFDYPPDNCQSPSINQILTPIKSNTSQSISVMEKFIDDKYESIKKVKQTSNVLPKSSITFENQKSNYIQPQQFQFHTLLIDSLNNQIDSLKSEVHFLREEIREKNNIIKHLLKNNNFDLRSNESTKQPKSNNLKLLSNESISNTNYQPINNNTNRMLNELNKTNDNIKEVSQTLINFDDRICKTIDRDISLIKNNDKYNDNSKDNSNISNNPFLYSECDPDEHLSPTNPPILNDTSNITHRKQKNLGSRTIINDKDVDMNDKDIDSSNKDIVNNDKDLYFVKTNAMKDKIGHSNSDLNDLNKTNSTNDENGNSDMKIHKNKRKEYCPEKEEKKDKPLDKEKEAEKKAIYIIGDSIIKELKGYELAKFIKYRKKVKIRSHPSGEISCLNDHIQPILRGHDTEHVVLHIGTNDLRYEKIPVQICHEIIDLAIKVRDKNIKVSISGIVQRNDGLNEKVLLVNDVLKKICESVDIEYINNVNIRPDVHLNRSKLHLNKKGNNILTSNIRSFLTKLF